MTIDAFAIVVASPHDPDSWHLLAPNVRRTECRRRIRPDWLYSLGQPNQEVCERCYAVVARRDGERNP